MCFGYSSANDGPSDDEEDTDDLLPNDTYEADTEVFISMVRKGTTTAEAFEAVKDGTSALSTMARTSLALMFESDLTAEQQDLATAGAGMIGMIGDKWVASVRHGLSNEDREPAKMLKLALSLALAKIDALLLHERRLPDSY